jgi:hypothetical protein
MTRPADDRYSVEETKLTPEEVAQLEAEAKQPHPGPSEEERMACFKDENPYLHIYAQEQWHGEAFMVANMQALLLLRKAIDDALLNGHGYVPAFVGDGEGYNTLIAKMDDPREFDNLAVPYNDEIAQETRELAVWPWKLPRIRQAGDDAMAWIEKKYTKEEAEEIIASLKEDREREQTARQGGDSILAQQKKDRGEA